MCVTHVWRETRDIIPQFETKPSTVCYEAAAASGDNKGGFGMRGREKGGSTSQRGEGRVTSDPADRLILSFQRPPLSLLFTSLKEFRGGVKKSRRE